MDHFKFIDKCMYGMVWYDRVQMVVQGPVVQSIISLTRSLVVKILTVLGKYNTISQVFLLKKM